MKFDPVRKIALALTAALPALLLRLIGVQLAPAPAIAVFGSAVVASAFLLVWSSEAARRDISSSLATAILAVIAVLPEYAVDLFFAWSAGHAPENAHYAAANMTGSNRLLLGLGWSFVVLLFVFGARRRGQRVTGVVLREARRLELGFLGAASLYSLVVPFTRRIAWYDAVVLLGIFFAYLWRAARGEQEEPRLHGVAKRIGDLPRRTRRAAVIGLGTGTLASYGRAGDVYRYYELNPDVLRVARSQFTYLAESPAKIETVLGDARLSMEREAPQNYDLIAVDAFSSDSIPVHLITREAMAVYLKHLKPGGVIAFHVTNRFLVQHHLARGGVVGRGHEVPTGRVHTLRDDVVQLRIFGRGDRGTKRHGRAAGVTSSATRGAATGSAARRSPRSCARWTAAAPRRA